MFKVIASSEDTAPIHEAQTRLIYQSYGSMETQYQHITFHLFSNKPPQKTLKKLYFYIFVSKPKKNLIFIAKKATRKLFVVHQEIAAVLKGITVVRFCYCR